MKKENWVWMPHAGHFICGNDCRFHLFTYVGGYVVSTVGELFPDESTREIYVKSRGIVLEGKGDARATDFLVKHGYVEIGVGRTYETMVFKAKRAPKDRQCCPWQMTSGSNLDFLGYNDPAAALKGHMKLCRKWAGK